MPLLSCLFSSCFSHLHVPLVAAHFLPLRLLFAVVIVAVEPWDLWLCSALFHVAAGSFLGLVISAADLEVFGQLQTLPLSSSFGQLHFQVG